MPYFNDEHRVDSPGYRPPGQRSAEPDRPVMTVAGHTTLAPRPQPRPAAETPVRLAFQGFNAAVDAQLDHNREAEVDYERRILTEEGVRERKAQIANSPAAKIVDMSEQTMANRQAEARQRYDNLIAGLVQHEDAAQEQRNTRYLQRVDREFDAADTSGQKVATATGLMEKADRTQLGLLIEDLPSRFVGSDTSWIEAKLVQVDPELGAAATELRLATQCSHLASYAATSVRAGFKTGSPPKKLDVLAPAVARLDPDGAALGQ
jgi:hypothetical protein